MKIALLSILAVSLLLFGCAQQQPVAGSEQGCITSAGYTWCAEKGKCIREADEKCATPPVVGNDRDAHGCIGSAGYTWCAELNKCIRSWEENCTQIEPAPSATCSLTLNPATIYAGDSTDIAFTVSTKENVKFTYNCGAEIREISTGGLTGGSRLCQFNDAGAQEVWIKAGNYTCASKTLNVRPRSEKKNCTVELIDKDLSSYVYNFKVSFDGFAPGDNITWNCGYTQATKKVTGDPVFGMQREELLNCDFAARPTQDYIGVYVGGMKCGEISTR